MVRNENCFTIKCQGVINTLSEIWLANCQWQMLSWDVGIISYDVTQKPFKSLGLWDVQLQIFKLGFRISKSSNWTFWILFNNIIQYLFWYTLTLLSTYMYILIFMMRVLNDLCLFFMMFLFYIDRRPYGLLLLLLLCYSTLLVMV